MRPRRVVLAYDPLPSELYTLIPYDDGRFYLWHIRIICEIIVSLSKLHLRGESDATALAVVYIEASHIDLMASPEQSDYLRRCYGSSPARVTTGLLKIAADYLGFESVSISVTRPERDTEPLPTLRTKAVSA